MNKEQKALNEISNLKMESLDLGESWYDRLSDAVSIAKKALLPDESASVDGQGVDELWDEVEDIFDKNTRPTGGGYEADYTDKSSFIEDCKSKFTLIKK